MFTDDQIKMLKADLDRKDVRTREGAGKRQLSYIEGWHAIAEANRIFGFHGWDRETLEMRLVAGPAELDTKYGKKWGTSYLARVRVRVIAGPDGCLITREGYGSGHGLDADLGRSHESSAKEAETDALKRCLMMFGNQFGLALYDKEQKHVSNGVDEVPERQITNEPVPYRLETRAANKKALRDAASKGTAALQAVWNTLNPEMKKEFKPLLEEELKPMAKDAEHIHEIGLKDI